MSNLGGNQITKDIATILNINFSSAEAIKNLNSSLIISPAEEREIIKLKITAPNDGPNMIRITKNRIAENIIKSSHRRNYRVSKNKITKKRSFNCYNK